MQKISIEDILGKYISIEDILSKYISIDDILMSKQPQKEKASAFDPLTNLQLPGPNATDK